MVLKEEKYMGLAGINEGRKVTEEAKPKQIQRIFHDTPTVQVHLFLSHVWEGRH